MNAFQTFFSHVRDFCVNHLGTIITFGCVLVLGLIIIRIVMTIFRRMVNKSRIKGAAGDFLLSMLRVVLLAIYLIALCTLLGVPTTSMVALFSAFALAVSLALQGTFSNVAAGIVVVLTKPFEEGDYVEIGSTAGTVQTITIFNTKLITPDNKVITLPNSTVSASNITNYSTMSTRRLEITLETAYGTDVEKVKAVALSVVAGHEEILKTPAPMVRLKAHGSSSLTFVLRVWVEKANYWPVNFDLQEELLAAFVENDITIPFQQLDVHITP